MLVHTAVEASAAKRVTTRRCHRLPKESAAQGVLEIQRRHDSFAQRVLEETDYSRSSRTSASNGRSLIDPSTARRRPWRLVAVDAAAAGDVKTTDASSCCCVAPRLLALFLLLLLPFFLPPFLLPLSSSSLRTALVSHCCRATTATVNGEMLRLLIVVDSLALLPSPL